MSVTVTELHAHAKALPEGTETERRAKISRLYYALFSHACEFHDSLPSSGDLLKREAGLHSQLAQKLTNPTVADAQLIADSRKVGTMQMLSHRERVKADYELTTEVTMQDVAKVARFVEQAIAIPIPSKAAA